jgi:hypothetical protein
VTFGVDFYDQVLRELITAVGAALFVGSAFALIRQRRPPQQPHERPSDSSQGQLTKAPVARTVTFMLIGLIVMVWGIASLAG